MDTDTTHSMVESFQDLDGRSLLQMTPEDFRGISEEHGQFIYEIFKQMCTVGKYIIDSYDFKYFSLLRIKRESCIKYVCNIISFDSKIEIHADHMFKTRFTVCW